MRGSPPGSHASVEPGGKILLVAGVTADLDLQAVDARLGPELPPLAIETLQGRLSADWSDEGFGLSTENLSLRTREGQVWPGGQLSLRHSRGRTGQPASTALNAEQLDLAALSALASHLPLSTATHGWLQRLQPAGLVHALSASWQGEAAAVAREAFAVIREGDLGLNPSNDGQLIRVPIPVSRATR